MVPQLRIWHYRIWLALAMALPALMVAAIFALGGEIPDAAAGKTSLAALPTVIAGGQSASNSVLLRSESDKGPAQQLEIQVNQTLKNPEVLVYLDFSSNTSQLLGRLTTMGVHRFDIQAEIPGNEIRSIRLFDPIKNKVIDLIPIKKQ